MQVHALVLFMAFAQPDVVAVPPSEKLAIVIGIGEYDDATYSVQKEATADAKRMAEMLINAPDGFLKNNVLLMTPDAPEPNNRPTRANIMRNIPAWLQIATKKSTVLFYFSGHGELLGDKAVLVPQDCVHNLLAEFSLDPEWVNEQIKKRNVERSVMILDACHAGGVGGAKSAPALLAGSLVQAARYAKGRISLLSCDADQRSYPYSEKGYGVFTWYLTEGLKGAADQQGDNDGWISAVELANHAQRHVIEWARANGRLQTPIMESRVSGEILLVRAPSQQVLLPKPDEQSAKEWLSLGANYQLGLYGLARDPEKGMEYFRKAAEAGNTTAMVNLGFLLQSGEGVAKDEKKALDWFQKAADLGDSFGMNALGVAYGLGLGVPVDKAQAVIWYRKAAEAGNTTAMFNLGILLQSGEGVAKDEKKALDWFQKAADLGDSLGMNSLGVAYGLGLGVPVDKAQAVTWYRKAVEAGNTAAMVNLGIALQGGVGVEKNENEALDWFRKAADLGDSFGMNALGVTYGLGLGVPVDLAQAVTWYRMAAEAGYTVAMVNLGIKLQRGEGVEKNENDALDWFRKAADLGDNNGMYNVGAIYSLGLGVPVDKAQAVIWYRKGAEAGNPWAMYNLGILLQEGEGVKRDKKEAREWLRKAADLGIKEPEAKPAKPELDL